MSLLVAVSLPGKTDQAVANSVGQDKPAPFWTLPNHDLHYFH